MENVSKHVHRIVKIVQIIIILTDIVVKFVQMLVFIVQTNNAQNVIWDI